MRDLFGDVVVTDDDVRAWVDALAPAFTSTERAFLYYVANWRVAEKIKRAKLEGTFDTTIEKARARRAFLRQRFRL